MAIKKRTELKLVVDDFNSLLIQKTPIKVDGGAITITPDYDMPVTVDTLQTSGAEPSLTHYKVIGMDTDWTSSATAGDWTISFTVPTLHTDVLKFAWGEDAVKSCTASYGNADGLVDGTTFTGVSVTFNKRHVICSLVIVNGAKDKLVIIRQAKLWANILKDANGDPYAVRFTGSIESEGDDLIVLEKNVVGA